MATRRHFPLHIHISTLFVTLLLVVGGLISGVGYTLSKEMLESESSAMTQRMSRETLGEVQKLMEPAEMAIKLIGRSALPDAATLRDRLAGLDMLRAAIQASPALSALYVGYANGDFFFVRHLPDEAERQAAGAPPGTQFIVQSIEHKPSGAEGRYLYVDTSLKVLKEAMHPEYAASFDPRARLWYQRALANGGLVSTAPYAFYSSGKTGTTLAIAARGGRAAIGGDITLDALGQTLSRLRSTKGTALALVSPGCQLIASDSVAASDVAAVGTNQEPRLRQVRELGNPVLTRLSGLIPALAGTPSLHDTMTVDGESWYTSIDRLSSGDEEPLYLVSATPQHEVLRTANRLRDTGVMITILIILVALPIVWLAARLISKPLQSLANGAQAVQRFEFAQPFNVESRISEVEKLATALDSMKRTIQRFLDIIQALAAEPSFDRLLPMLLNETLAAADADSGVLYLVDEDVLQPASARSQSLSDVTAALEKIPQVNALTMIQEAIRDGLAHTGQLTAEDIRRAGLSALSPEHGQHGVAVPLLNRQRQLVGVFLLLRATAMEDAQLSFVKALAGVAASALETRELIKAQRDMFEALIQLIAGAIDTKSPYTGGHCARVPALTKMLAKAACEATSGPYQAFQLGEQEWEALHVAAWLHDCGKVTTPEYVVDKATKLETIYDRIHEIRMRFEVLKRDAEIACLQAVARGEEAASAQARRDAECRQLDDDFAFVAACNEGGEFMEPAHVDRLHRIAARTWLRTLNDRVGLSRDEKARKDRMPAADLPAVEPLLADKQEHRIARSGQDRFAEGNPWGFRMAVPEYLYDRGELHNLSVARGTLSEEERFKINEHIMQTLVMLSQLPFPKHLRQVPEIAGGHHEKMDGTGYPKRLKGEEMSPLARMMAIADIFEALTAPDRPYKKAKTLSESIHIMSCMKRDQHIDPALFELFLVSGVYRDYAAQFMNKEQIDHVDIGRYVQSAI